MSTVDQQVVERDAPTNEFLKVETRGIEPIPASERKGSPRDVAWLWVAAFANFVSLITGALLITFGLGVAEAIAAVAAGCVLAASLHGLLSVAGPRFGTTQRSEEHTSELQSRPHLVCRLLLEKKKKQ